MFTWLDKYIPTIIVVAYILQKQEIKYWGREQIKCMSKMNMKIDEEKKNGRKTHINSEKKITPFSIYLIFC